jgi:hypothetical protein
MSFATSTQEGAACEQAARLFFGSPDTQKSAETQALAACNNNRCRIVVSDCN